MPSAKSILVTGALILCTSAAEAADFSLSDMFQLHGYGTLGVAHSNQDQADVIGAPNQNPGAGYSSAWTPNLDTKLGLQLDTKFTDRLTAVVQVISQNRYDNSYTGKPIHRYVPSVQWANLKWQITDDISFRAGRMVLPLMMFSEFRDVGYANTLVRPPIEMYGIVPFSTNDGADLTWHHTFGSVTNSLVLFDGGASLRQPGLTLESHQKGITDTVEVGSWTVRAAYMRSPIKTTTHVFDNSFYTNFIDAAGSLPNNQGDAAAAAAQDLYNRYQTTHWVPIDHYDLGAVYDPGRWFAMAELYEDRNPGILGHVHSQWVAAGFRYKTVTPYVMYAHVSTSFPYEAGIPLGGLPAPLAAYGGGINGLIGVLQNVLNANERQLAFGVRWDFMKNLDFKAEYAHLQAGYGSTGDFQNAQPGFTPGSGADLISFTVDFVF